MDYNLILAGVGGQGILSIAQAISVAVVNRGWFVKQAEVHGMAQRGGAVQSHLRFSDRKIHSDIIPLVRVNPQYPMRAAQRGIEGWVEVEFTITPAGTVSDPVVIGAKPKGMFNRAALRAIRKWKYNPRMENGVAVERPGVKVRLTFELED